MSWKSVKTRLAQAVFGNLIKLEVAQAKAQQSLTPAMFGSDPSLYGFRKLTGPDVPRDLPVPTQAKMQEMAYFLYLTNPMAQWLVNISKDYIIGEGVTLKCQDPRTQQIVDSFWSDPVNKFPLKLGNKVRELSLYGEQCYPVFIAPGTGRVRLGYLDPCLLNEVVLDPENAEVAIGVITRKQTGFENIPVRRYRVILSVGEEELTPLAQQMRQSFTDGDCFYFTVNKVSNGSRGISDLIAKADWLDGYEQFLYQRLERSDLANRIVYDLTLQGFTQEQIDALMKTFKLPKPGGVHAHNEKVTLDVKSPDMKAQDAYADSRMFVHQCLAGFPEHWYAGGQGSNRATAGEMDEPTYKMLSARQRDIKAMIEEMALFAVRQAKAAGYLEQDADESVSAQFAEMVTADLTKIGAVIQNVATSIATMLLGQVITKEEGRLIFSVVVNALGVELPAMDATAMAEANANAQFDTASQDYTKQARVKPRRLRVL
jgi:hypothetical protein